MIAPNHGLTGKQLAALNLLAASVQPSGQAVATPGVVQAGGRTLGVVRLAITEMGRATVGA